MSIGTLLTLQDFLELPDDGMERDLIRGEIVEQPMTRRNRWHSFTEAQIAILLGIWQRTQPKPWGTIVSGEAGCNLRDEPASTVGMDVAYFAPGAVDWDEPSTTMLVGPPVLAVEVLSANDTQEMIDAKVEEYLATGVRLVWLVNPRFRTVTVYRPDAKPRLFNDADQISAEPHLPGLSFPVAEIFAPHDLPDDRAPSDRSAGN